MQRWLCLLTGTLFALAAAEIGIRLKQGRLLEANDYRMPFGVRYLGPVAPNSFDPLLGWVPKPGRRPWDVTVETIDERGLRITGGRPGAGWPILAVGDSFTFGDEVDDDETWPAYLEELVDRPVLNGAVSGYGLDQVVLRAERLIAAHAPELVIVAACPDGVDRCERVFFCQWKPYFALEGDGLVLENVPVPAGRKPDGSWAPHPPPDSGWIAHSALANFVFSRLAGRWWYFGFVEAHDQGEEVAVRLLRRLAERARAAGAEMTFVVLDQWQSNNRARIVPVVERARAAGLDVLDLGPEVAARARDPRYADAMYRPGGHYTPEANRWIAEQLAARLRLRERPVERVPARR